MLWRGKRGERDGWVRVAGGSCGLLRSVQRLDRCDRHQILYGVGEVPVERDQRVGVELGQCDVLGVKGVWPPEQAGGLPGDILEDAVPEQPYPERSANFPNRRTTNACARRLCRKRDRSADGK